WDNEAQTDSVIDAARWRHTGDLAVMDAAGYLNIAGRIKDMVIRGGENVYPREVEEFLYTHPAIEDVQVTVTGKVQKFVMREVSVSELDLGEADRTPTA